LILDTTYILPLARIGVDTDLLLAIAEERTNLKLDEITLSLISVFELQAKATKLGIPARFVNESIRTMADNLTLTPFSDPKVVELSIELRSTMSDYIDCIIVATAAALREDLVTEDSRIWSRRKSIQQKYGVSIFRYRDVLKKS
jgi:predicted nucleic acid-binding protein